MENNRYKLKINNYDVTLSKRDETYTKLAKRKDLEKELFLYDLVKVRIELENNGNSDFPGGKFNLATGFPGISEGASVGFFIPRLRPRERVWCKTVPSGNTRDHTQVECLGSGHIFLYIRKITANDGGDVVLYDKEYNQTLKNNNAFYTKKVYDPQIIYSQIMIEKAITTIKIAIVGLIVSIIIGIISIYPK